jgi:predicted RNA-binding protein YlqC (UPF0109 family)
MDDKTSTAIQTALESVLALLVDNPGLIRVQYVISPRDCGMTFLIHSHPDDCKRLIGKQGTTANALRTIFHCVLARHGWRNELAVVTPDRKKADPA